MRVMPKQLTTQAPQLDICCLPNWWVRQGDAVVISCRGIVSRIDIISTAMHFGGRREWFKCPDCGDRARILYGPNFACRSCQQLNYPSTRRCSRDRAITRSVQMRRRLGGDGSLLEPFPRRPKGMKRKTWWRLFAKASRDEQRGIAEMADRNPSSYRARSSAQSGREALARREAGEVLTDIARSCNVSRGFTAPTRDLLSSGRPEPVTSPTYETHQRS